MTAILLLYITFFWMWIFIFFKSGPWCFILTTGSGGVGLNLTGADTVIFLDADWNPQNDIQAMARCHRIGQNRPVRVIRLIGRYTIEQHMQARIRDKLRFTDRVMGNEEMKLSAFDMMTMIKQSLGTLKEQKNTRYQITDEELEIVIGKTDNYGDWLPVISNKENQVLLILCSQFYSLCENIVAGIRFWVVFLLNKNVIISTPMALRLDPDEVDKQDTDCNDYRVFEGHSYRISAKDEAVFEELRMLQSYKTSRGTKRRCLQRDEGNQEEKEDFDRLKEADINRRLLAEKRRLAAQEKKSQIWAANGYISNNLPLPVVNNEVVDGMIEEGVSLFYVHGDVTKPQINDEDKTSQSLILHCVDNSGKFGSRGIFACLNAKNPLVAERYEMISRMDDLKLGSSHLIPDIKDLREPSDGNQKNSLSAYRKESVILLVAQNYRHRGKILPTHLEQCFSRVGEYARHNDASVHMARIGYGTSLSWYNVERLIKKHIANYGVPIYVYHAMCNRLRTLPEILAVDDDDSSNNPSPKDGEQTIKRSSEHSFKENVDNTTGSGSTGLRESEETEDEALNEDVLSNSKVDGYRSPRNLALFADIAVSLYGLRQEEVSELSEVIIANGGYVITDESELNDATHVVIPSDVNAVHQFSKFRALFNSHCIFVEKNWITDSVKVGEKLSTTTNDIKDM
ncbi:helicase protein [Dictyocaulus viviparus]|uniref:Helicase protein n=1 Tax=Dictyocaulus viviparus TaxID=29172 RepID=A0A0D8YAW1_DICVI|nr:helicase protein [Dictyocaulus viviparus]